MSHLDDDDDGESWCSVFWLVAIPAAAILIWKLCQLIEWAWHAWHTTTIN